MISIHYI